MKNLFGVIYDAQKIKRSAQSIISDLRDVYIEKPWRWPGAMNTQQRRSKKRRLLRRAINDYATLAKVLKAAGR